MAQFSWTSPNPGGVYASQANYQVRPADIGSLVAAIMRQRQLNAANQQQSTNQLLAGIGQGISGAYGAYQNSANTAQVADYLQLQRQAQAAGVPGGESQAMLEAEQNMSPQAQLSIEQYMAQNAPPSFYTDPVTGQTIYGSSGRGYHAMPRSSSMYDQPTAHEQGVRDRYEAGQIKSTLEDKLGGEIPIGKAGDVTYGDFDPSSGSFVPSDNGQYGVVGGLQRYMDQGVAGPWYKLGYGGQPPQAHQYAPPGAVYSREDAQAIQEEAKRYHDLIKAGTYGGFGSGGSGQLNTAIRKIQAAYARHEITRDEAAQQFRDLGIRFEE